MNNGELCSNEHSKYIFFFKGNLTHHVAAILDVYIVENGASCYRGRLLQGRFMQNYHIDGEIADSSYIRIHQGNH